MNPGWLVTLKLEEPQETAIISAGEMRILVGMGMFLKLVVGVKNAPGALTSFLRTLSLPSSHKTIWFTLGGY
jgi:hypothetical protein